MYRIVFGGYLNISHFSDTTEQHLKSEKHAACFTTALAEANVDLTYLTDRFPLFCVLTP